MKNVSKITVDKCEKFMDKVAQFEDDSLLVR